VVFETGTGAGYHAAVLAELADRVYSVEVIEPLAMRAARLLGDMGYANVETHIGDGYFGWPEKAPFDVIIVKEAIDHIPPPLLKQLKPGGRLIAPIGPLHDTQNLTLVEKGTNGDLKTTNVLEVRFSPLQGGERI
jgi:protein-L-isoaspartate(D-aspartate) O-methyltransferase